MHVEETLMMESKRSQPHAGLNSTLHVVDELDLALGRENAEVTGSVYRLGLTIL